MAKRFLKQVAHSDKDDAGYLSGLISIFNFRVGQHTRKFPSDEKSGSGKYDGLLNCQLTPQLSAALLCSGTGDSRKKIDLPSTFEIEIEDINDEDGTREKKIISSSSSVKTLMEEEMSTTHNLTVHMKELEHPQFESRLAIHQERNKKKKNKSSNLINGAPDLDFGQYNPPIPTERSLLPFDLAVCDEIDSKIDDTDFSISQKQTILQKAVVDVSLKMLNENVAVQSREFVDALDILSSNKELFLKLIQEPNSRLLKYIQDIRDTHVRSTDNSQNINSFVLLKPSLETTQYDSVTQTSSPLPQSCQSLKHQESGRRKSKSFFSLKGIKRKLRRVISMDGMLNRIPNGSKDSGDTQNASVLASKDFDSAEGTSQPSAVAKKRDNKTELKIKLPPYREPFFYEMLAALSKKDSSPTVPKSFKRVVSLQEYSLLSPKISPKSNKELVLSPRKVIFFQSRQSSDQDIQPQVTDTNQEGFVEDLNTKEASDNKSSEEHNDLAVISESNGNQSSVVHEGCEEEGSSRLSDMGTLDDKPQLAIPSLSIQRLKDPDGMLEKPERPSPVSVLYPFFSEDIASPESAADDPVNSHLQSQRIEFLEHDSSDLEDKPSTYVDEKEFMYTFITTLLHASGLNGNGDLERWNLSDDVLDPSLLNQEEISQIPLPDDPKLLFDCVNEVLMEIRDIQFTCPPWISLIRPVSPTCLKGRNLIEEVCKEVDSNLLLSEFTLDQITWKDMESRTWVDFRFETETVIVEMGDAILEELIEETILKL